MNIPYQFGLSNNYLKEFEFNQTQADRVKKLLNLKDSPLIIDICRHYIQNFIPSPLENEDEYWMCSCFPGNKSSIPVRINIYWHEVFRVYVPDNSVKLNPDLYLMMFTHKDYLPAKIINQIESKISEVESNDKIRYPKGLNAQFPVFLPIKSYFKFIKNEDIYKSIRQYNYELSCIGRKAHKGHNYEFIRYLLKK